MFILVFIFHVLLTVALGILGILALSLLTFIIYILIGEKARDKTPEVIQLFAIIVPILSMLAWAMLVGGWNIARGLGRKTPT